MEQKPALADRRTHAPAQHGSRPLRLADPEESLRRPPIGSKAFKQGESPALRRAIRRQQRIARS
jgi:hypothetical protein